MQRSASLAPDRAIDAPGAAARHATIDALSPNFQAIGLFRVALALYLVVDFFVNDYSYFATLYGDGGVLPLAALDAAPHQPGLALVLPLLRLVDGPAWPVLFPFLYALTLLALVIGWRTRVATAAAFVLNGYLYWRNPQIGSGADLLAHLLLLWCLFLPLSRHWSVDAALDPAPRERPYPALPIVAMRLQIASLYLFAALFKLAGGPWRNGDALGFAMSDTVFGATPISLWLLEHLSWLLHPAAFAVIGFQLAFPFLIYAPWHNEVTRAVALTGTALMHIAFIVCLNIGGFPYLCLAMLLLLVPDRWIDRLLRRRRTRLAAITIFHEPECGFCRRTALLLREFLLSAETKVLPASADAVALRTLTATNSWVVRAPDGTDHLKWRAVAYVLRQSRWAAPLGWLSDRPALRGAFERLYDAIGRSRRRLGPPLARLLPYRSERTPGLPTLTVCGGLAVVALASNAASVASLSIDVPPVFDQIAGGLQVRQRWDLFAPNPTNIRWTFGMVAHRIDGSTTDLTRPPPEPLVWLRPDGTTDFANHRWLKYFSRLDRLSDDERGALGAYLCRRAGAATRTVEVTLAKQPLEARPVPERVFRYRFDCAPAPR